MPPSSSDPSLPNTKLHTVYLGFKGLNKINEAGAPEGYLAIAENCKYDSGFARPLIKCTSTLKPAISAMGWKGTAEYPMALLPLDFKYNEPHIAMFSNERLHAIGGMVGDPDSSWVGVGTMGMGAGKTIVGIGTSFTTEGWAYGSKIFVDGDWYTVDFVTDNTHLDVQEAISFSPGSSYKGFSTDLVATNSYGPRYALVAGGLFIAGKYATYSDPHALASLRVLTRQWRARDIIAFAGRPVLCGVYEGDSTPNYYSANFGVYLSHLRWPTKGDATDWTSYGSGFLQLKDDSSPIVAGANWGEAGYVFTLQGIHSLVETGMSASNPIVAKKLPIHTYMYPTSNVVAGQKGLYWWTATNWLVRFNGQQIEPLYMALDDTIKRQSNARPHLSYISPLSGVLVGAAAVTGENSFRKVYLEQIEGFVELTSNTSFCGMGEEANTYWTLESTSIPISPSTKQAIRAVDGTSGTLDAEGNALSYTLAWKITQDPHILKRCKGLRIFYKGTGSISKVYMAPSGTAKYQSNVSLPSVPEDVATLYVKPPSTLTDLAPTWWVKLEDIPNGVEIFGAQFMYTESGSIGEED